MNDDEILDEEGRYVGRKVAVRGERNGVVLEWGRRVGTPPKRVKTALIRFPNGEISLWDCSTITFLE